MKDLPYNSDTDDSTNELCEHDQCTSLCSQSLRNIRLRSENRILEGGSDTDTDQNPIGDQVNVTIPTSGFNERTGSRSV
jgi:hypothetical protein